MKVSVTIHSAKARAARDSPDHGMYIAWAELDGIDITGPLARHTNRDTVEHHARLELAHRLARMLGAQSRRDLGNGDGPAAKRTHSTAAAS